MSDFYFMGRPDELGNRIEEIILLESICRRDSIRCNYVWNNKHYNRSYDILLKSNNVRLIENNEKDIDFVTVTDSSKNFSQEDFLSVAQGIQPTFDIYFENNVKPVGIHIRGTDRLGKKSPHFMKNENELNRFLSKTIELLNESKPQYIFVCSDDRKIKEKFVKYLDKGIVVIDPICEGSVPEEYRDFFSLTLCDSIYMCTKFSTFSIIASLIGNIPLISFVFDDEVANRYKALFRYELDLGDPKYTCLKNQRFKRVMKKIDSKLKDILWQRTKRK